MKNIKNLLALAIAMLTVASSAQTPEAPQTTDQGSAVEAVLWNFPNRPSLHAPSVRSKPIVAEVTVYAGPLKGSANYTTFLSDVVNGGGQYPKVTILKPEDVSAPVGSGSGLPEGRTLWFLVKVTSEESFVPGRFLVNILSDTSNIFNKTESYYDSDTLKFIYSTSSKGVIWGQNGVKTYVDQGPWSAQAVNEFIFVGTASKTMNFSSLVQYEANRKWMLDFSNFTMTGIWTMYDANGVVLTTASKTVETRPKIVVPVALKITRISSGKSALSIANFNGSANVFASRDPSMKVNRFFVGVIEGGNPLSILTPDDRLFYQAEVK